MTVRRKERGGTAAGLAAANETPLQRELYVEYDTGKMKVGDGVTAYNDLDYINGDVVNNNNNTVTVSGGNMASLAGYASLSAAIAAIGSAKVPLLIDTDWTETGTVIVPDNVLFVDGGGTIQKSGGGNLELEGLGFVNPVSQYPILIGFDEEDVIFTGTNYPHRISSSLWDDSDWGGRALKASAAFTSMGVAIDIYPGGTPTAQLIVKSEQAWMMAPGTFENSITTVQQRCGLLQDNSAFIGSGVGRTIIKESSVDGMQMFLSPSQEVVGSRDGSNENIVVRDFTYQGASAGVSVNSSFPAVNMGNTRNFYVGNIHCIDSHGYAVSAGANGALGNCADGGRIENISCDGLQTQQIAVVNGRNIDIINPIFRNIGYPGGPSQAVIDLEPNSAFDICENINIIHPIIDGRNAQSTANGISVNAAGAPGCKNVQVISPEILGADDYRANNLPDANFNATTNKIHAPSHGYLSKTQVVLTTTGTLKTGLDTSSTYWLIVNDSDYFQLASSYANALTSTAIDFSGSGSGLHSVIPLRKMTVGVTVSGGENVSISNPMIQGMGQQGISIANSTRVALELGSSRICGGGGSPGMIVAGSSDCDFIGHRVETTSLGISQDDTIVESEITVTVNTISGSPTVTRTSGNLIYPHWVGKTVTINGVDYVVKSVGNVDESTLELTTNAASTLTGTTLTTKFSSNRYIMLRSGTLTRSSTGTSKEYFAITSDGSITIPNDAYIKGGAADSILGYNSSSNYTRVGSSGGISTRV
jgi:hypothetical protein